MDTSEVGGLQTSNISSQQYLESIFRTSQTTGIHAILEKIEKAGPSLNGLRPEVVVGLLIAKLQGAASNNDPLMEEVIVLLKKAQSAMQCAAQHEQQRTTLN
ncbi:hypothetical protein [Stenotrophomonas sp. GD03657]|uniref:hypothetical protein n=1 Tax=Stenotrophomonas sp. GD03657 TaxID=2975363 RepID=UPI00244D21BF|nr:hypothetical protein [Stenotrophomonas sp. GD03657]MDH2154030.1 hypothetical protein [Stenotrophomonas sp. GD03657]